MVRQDQFSAIGAMFSTIVPTCALPISLDKRQVRLPVLNTIFPLFRRAQETEPGTTDTALFQQSTDNLFRGLMLRDPTVAAEPKAPERRAYREVIAGSSVARRRSEERRV